ncbi:HSP20 family protein [Tamaricihabitans halophyticus]|uniref:HSP20 family protein n=1 Tax=Tamaricihabitans halophyticus TaxID=1262583 RepID=A0A4V2SSX9_9PSEU|nr:Hsp20/alpha crystallin family protein [Tamaricihabitans halophyticus]TCP48476.1 HSP20 family protein [Tamaricihabitans halophyticus]
MPSVFQRVWRWLRDFEREVQRGSDLRPLRADESTQRLFTPWEPAVDCIEQRDRFVIRADLPGIRAADLDYRLTRRGFTLSGIRQAAPRTGCCLGDVPVGPFRRIVTIPSALTETKILCATLHDGILEVTIGGRRGIGRGATE